MNERLKNILESIKSSFKNVKVLPIEESVLSQVLENFYIEEESLLGTIILALSVNLVELACSLGFPTIFLEILSLNNILGFKKIIYLLVYIIFYLLDDLIIFLIAVFTLKTKGISTKYNKIVNLVGGILMIIMGILLIFKPEWIMLNF